jgi:hypothetical protein
MGSHLERLIEEARMGHHPLGEPDTVRLLRGEGEPHGQAHGIASSDPAGEASRPAIGGENTESNLRQPPFRALRGHEQIAAEGHDAADPDGVAVDGADQGLGKIPQDLEGAVPSLGQAFDESGRRGHGVRLRILQVGPGREGAARLVAGEHGAADLVVVFHGGEVSGDALVEVGAPGIAGLRAAQGDDADVAALLEDNGHGDVLPTAARLRRSA